MKTTCYQWPNDHITSSVQLLLFSVMFYRVRGKLTRIGVVTIYARFTVEAFFKTSTVGGGVSPVGRASKNNGCHDLAFSHDVGCSYGSHTCNTWTTNAPTTSESHLTSPKQNPAPQREIATTACFCPSSLFVSRREYPLVRSRLFIFCCCR